MRIFFIGTVSFSEKALKKLFSLNAHVVGVATKSKSDFNADHIDLAPLAKENNVPVKYVRDINASHILEWIKELAPDVIFCFGWSSLIKKELLALPPIGVIGFHPTELPQNRGRHPLIWSLVLGLDKSATSFFFMGEGADDGDILSQKVFSITYEDDAASVYKKIENKALEQIEEFLPSLKSRKFDRQQQDHTRGNIWRKRQIEDGAIDFRMSSLAIYNLVRALTHPYVGAHINYKNQQVKIWKIKEEELALNNIEPGKVLSSENPQILIKTYDGAVRIIEHDFVKLPKKGEYL